MISADRPAATAYVILTRINLMLDLIAVDYQLSSMIIKHLPSGTVGIIMKLTTNQ